MVGKRFFCFGWMVLCLVLNSRANPMVNYLGIEQGLSNNSVTSIYQDRQGFMWFGTYDGLNRYDGYNFSPYRNNLQDSLSLINNHVVTMHEDADQNLWVGTWQGLSIFDRLTGKFKPIYWRSADGRIQKLTNEVSSIETAGNGHIIMAAQNSGFIEVGKAGETGNPVPLKTRHGSSFNYVARLIKKAPDGTLWAWIAEVGLCLYMEKEKAFIQVVASVAFANISIATHSNGKIWVGTRSGLLEYDSRSGHSKWYNQANSGISHNNVVGLCMDANGKIWIGTDGGGINLLDISTCKIVPLEVGVAEKSLTSPTIYSLYEDREKRMWIGTLRGGINIIDPQKNQFLAVSYDSRNPNSLINNFVLSLCEENPDRLWIGTDGGGLSIWDRAANKFSNYKHEAGNPGSLSSNFITTICRDNHSNTWIGTFDGGINLWMPGTRSFKKYECKNPQTGRVYPHVWTIYLDRENNLWACLINGGGLFKYNSSSDQFELFDNRIPSIISLKEDEQGNLWAGTFEDLVRIDRLYKKHWIYKIGSAIRGIHPSKENLLWICTESKGLIKWDRNSNRFYQYTSANGMPNNAALNLLEDKKGKLWISTYYGLTRFNPQTRVFRNFYESDGLQSNQFNYNAALVSSKGEMIFGGIKGFNFFNPDSINLRNSMPPLRVTGISVSNEPAQQHPDFVDKIEPNGIEQLKLPYDKAALSVNFAALEFSAPDKISYAYYLEGWDKGWNYSGNGRVANYTRLNDGHYKLWIKNTNRDGEWSEPSKELEVVVLPPWFRSWWAYTFYLLLAALLFNYYRTYKRKQSRLEFEVQLSKMQAEQEKELNEKKLNFFTNISHEFRTPLTLIINPVKDLLKRPDKKTETPELDIVYRNARRLLSLVDQVLLFRKAGTSEDALRVSKINVNELGREVWLCFTQQAKTKNIDYRFSCPDFATEVYADREKIEIALFNLVSNAIKYTPAGGLIELTITSFDKGCRVVVSDSGPGIPAEKQNQLFEKFYRAGEPGTETGFGIGLYVSKTFVESHKGSLMYKTKPSGGASFTMELLAGTSHLSNTRILEGIGETPSLIHELAEEEAPVSKATQNDDTASRAIGDIVSEDKRMLVADDNEQIRNYIAQLFAAEFKVFQAESGEEALSMARQFSPDIIISDVVMGGMTGIELCTKVKNDNNLCHIPVILLTASSAAETKLKGIEGGADDYITKPFDKDILVARVNNLLKSRNTLQEYFYNAVTLKENNIKISEEYKLFLEKCIAIVEEHIDRDDFNIKMLASLVGMSHSNLYRRVKSISGQSVNAFIRFIRLRKAAGLFIHTDCNVSEAAFQVGITDTRYFRDQFNQLFGINPSEYIRKYRKPFQKKYNLNENAVKDATRPVNPEP